MAIKVYSSKHCRPCRTVDELIKEGRFEGEIELIDIETDDGFARFKKEVLEQGHGAVPSAYKEGQRCTIRIDDAERYLIIDCPTDRPPSSDQG